MKFTFVLAVAVAGCGTKPNPNSCADDHCNDPSKPFCDEDGSIAGKPDTCIAVECMPGTFETCRGDAALTCNATGNSYELRECEYGCDDATGCKACNTPECEQHIIPRYLPNVCNELDANEPATLSSVLITDNEANCSFIAPQTGGPEICVYRRSAISVAANTTLRVAGARAIALVADRDVVIDGTIDVSGLGGSPGAIAATGTNANGVAGGGAGFRHAGGAGGTTTADGGMNNGGALVPNPMTSTVLVGGRSVGQFTGRGGGALTIISCRGTVKVAGLIDANGSGGAAASEILGSIPVMYDPPIGGGSGGYVVLQGINATVTGQIFANGGGGGSGQVQGAAGAPGQRSTAVAQGGVPPGGAAGTGGNGGTGAITPTDGTKPVTASATNFPGAGGGSSGFLQVFTAPNGALTLSPAMASPMIEGYLTLATNR